MRRPLLLLAPILLGLLIAWDIDSLRATFLFPWNSITCMKEVLKDIQLHAGTVNYFEPPGSTLNLLDC